MGAAQEVKNQITANWRSRRVAHWVIDNLPLLEREDTHPPCPIYSVSRQSGLSFHATDFRHLPKFVLSGGIQGTGGHIDALNEMHEIRALKEDVGGVIAVMLEPDAYIQRKGALPIVNLSQRKRLWCTSGLVDAVILLPTRPERTNPADHYGRIHDFIKPAWWCTNVENPAWFGIIQRGDTRSFDLIRLLKHAPKPHTSFLNSTRQLTARETKAALFPYLVGLVNHPDLYTVPFGLPAEDVVQRMWVDVSKGL